MGSSFGFPHLVLDWVEDAGKEKKILIFCENEIYTFLDEKKKREKRKKEERKEEE